MTAAHPTAGYRPTFPGPKPPLAEVLAELVNVVPALLDKHRPDRRGDCRVCSLPQAGRVPYPCTLSREAANARRITAGPADL